MITLTIIAVIVALVSAQFGANRVFVGSSLVAIGLLCAKFMP